MNDAKQGSAAKAGIPFKDMTPRQKVIFVLKLTISILSFGFIYPHLMSD